MSLSESVAVTAAPTFVFAALFSGTVRVAVSLLNIGSALLAPTGPRTALADLPEP